MEWFWIIIAAIFAGVGTGLAGLSAATVMVPILIVLCPSFSGDTGVYSVYYYHKQNRENSYKKANEELDKKILEELDKSKRRYGSPKIAKILQKQGIQVSSGRYYQNVIQSC